MTFKQVTEIDWIPMSTAFVPGVPCLVATEDSEMVRYQVAAWEVGKGWRNQFMDRVYNVRYWAYITDLPKEKVKQ